VPEGTAAHCRMVAELARALAIELNRAGFHIDLDLVTAAGFLHDIAKGLGQTTPRSQPNC